MKGVILKLAITTLLTSGIGAGSTAETTANPLDKAEGAVLLAPADVTAREQLCLAYLRAGRFVSAEAACADALQLAPEQGQAALGLALARIALGKGTQALAALERARGRVPDTDYGLALALAGDVPAGLALLEAAARESHAGPRERQNLALIQALSGLWDQARTTAGVDLASDLLEKRVRQWVRFTQPQGNADQIGMLLGVRPADDPGLPVALAGLEKGRSDAIASNGKGATTGSNVVAPAVPAVPVVRVMTATTASAARGEGFVVQLGAYSSESRLMAAWDRLAQRSGPMLRDHGPISALVPVRSHGQRFFRLSIGGFGTRGQAVSACRAIRAQGGQCFVRARNGDAPILWAGRGGRVDRYASR